MVLMSEKFLPQGPGLEALDLPDTRALLVVGDVHGQAPALRALLDAFGARATPGLDRTMIFLGDLIDRGPDSLGCLQAALCEAQDRARADTVHYLPGNHELMLTDGIDAAVALAAGEGDPRDLGPRTPAAAWMMNGGHAFLQEVFPDMNERLWQSEAEMFLDFADVLPHPGHGSFLGMVRSWPSHVRIGDLLFVHAGLAPKRPFTHTLELTQQDHFPRSFMDSQLSDRHWAWIRDPFLMWQGGWREDGAMEGPGCLVFHGHTIPRKADHLHLVDREDLRGVLDRSATNARICLDGGAARGTSVAGALIEPDGITLLVSPVRDLLL